MKKQYPGLSDVNFKKCEHIWTLHIHVCSSKSVEKYGHILLCASCMEKWFCVYKLAECKRFRNLPIHKMKCHKCTIGTGYFICINVMWPWRAFNQAVFMICYDQVYSIDFHSFLLELKRLFTTMIIGIFLTLGIYLLELQNPLVYN